MTAHDIQIRFEYDRWANARVLKAASALTLEQFSRDLGGAFSSVRETLVHIFGGEWIWLHYWQHPPRNSDELSALRAQRDARFAPLSLAGIDAVRSMWSEVEREQMAFLDGITDESLHAKLPFRGGQIELVYLMEHVVNHSTYHRGQISLMMRQLRAEPVATDFHVFMAECHLGASA